MKLNLINRDTSGELIAFVKLNTNSYYCIAPVEFWIGHWWNGYVDLSQGNLEELYFDYLSKFRIDYLALKAGYEELKRIGDEFAIEGNKPKLYIDFGDKYLASIFYEQSLEDKIPEKWEGVFGDVEAHIPNEYHYWKEIEST